MTNASQLSHSMLLFFFQNERLRSLIKQDTTRTEGKDLQNALSRINQLSKEKIVLTELSNRLRAELSKAGIVPSKPSIVKSSPQCVGHCDSADVAPDMRVNQAVRGKLDQLERLQYELTKADISSSAHTTSKTKLARTKQQSPLYAHQSKQAVVNARVQAEKPYLPEFIDQTSSSGSSFKAKGKAAALQPARSSQSRKFVARVPKVKPKSNVAWVKDSKHKRMVHDQRNSSTSSVTAVADENSIVGSLVGQDTSMRDPSGLIDSMDLGSSIQEAWKILDDQPSLNSTNPD